MLPKLWEEYERFREFRLRELVIVAAATLDAALQDLLAKRLAGPTKVIEDFLGCTTTTRLEATLPRA